MPDLKPLPPQTGSHFSPADREEHERGNRGEDVPDYCRHCGAGFMSHTNGRCPK